MVYNSYSWRFQQIHQNLHIRKRWLVGLVAKSTFATPWTVAYQAPLSMSENATSKIIPLKLIHASQSCISIISKTVVIPLYKCSQSLWIVFQISFNGPSLKCCLESTLSLIHSI